jgi:hypothetical protein
MAQAKEHRGNSCSDQEPGSRCISSCGFCTGGSGTPAPLDIPSALPSSVPTGGPTPSPTPTLSIVPSRLLLIHRLVQRSFSTMRPSSSPSKAPTKLSSKSHACLLLQAAFLMISCSPSKLIHNVEAQCNWLVKKNQETPFETYCSRVRVKTAWPGLYELLSILHPRRQVRLYLQPFHRWKHRRMRIVFVEYE